MDKKIKTGIDLRHECGIWKGKLMQKRLHVQQGAPPVTVKRSPWVNGSTFPLICELSTHFHYQCVVSSFKS